MNVYVFIVLLIGSVAAGWYATYLNSIIPKPETLTVYIQYLFSDQQVYATTALMDLLAGLLIAILGVQVILFGVSFMVRKSHYYGDSIFQESSIIKKIGICLLILIGLAIFFYSFVFTGYFLKLLFVVLGIGAGVLLVMYIVTKK